MFENADNIHPFNHKLSGDWEFTYIAPEEKNENGVIPEPPETIDYDTTMPIPGYWDDNQENLQCRKFRERAKFNPDYKQVEFPLKKSHPNTSLPFLIGTGFYRKQVKLSCDDENSRIVLRIGAIISEAWIWLNGKMLKHQTIRNLPFSVELDPYWRHGETNEIIIAISNLKQDVTGCDIRGYAGFSAGIRGPLELKISRGCRIHDLYVRTGTMKKSLQWKVTVSGTRSCVNLQLHYKIIDPVDNSAILSGSRPVNRELLEWETGVEGLELWSDRNPKLYQLQCEIRKDDARLDSLTQSFGLRRISCCGTSLLLDGSPLYLRGECEHGYFPLTCNPPDDPEFYRNICRKLKELGYNWIRFHTWVPNPEYLQAADETGLFIQIEAPRNIDAGYWREILRYCRSHPSVILYCTGNEEFIDEAHIELLESRAKQLRKIVPDGLFNPLSALRGVEYGTKEQLGESAVTEPYPHHPDRLEKLKEFADVFSTYSWAMLSYTASTRDGDWREIDRRLKAYGHPCMSHEIGITTTYLDLDLEERYKGTRIGTDLYRAVREYLEKNGLRQYAPLYYRNSCAWARILYKYNLETARLCRFLAGYDHLGAYDHHWHRYGYPCGVMNEFYELKPGESSANFRRSNNESVLLLDLGHDRNFISGDKVSIDLHVSWFNRRSIESAVAEWRLSSLEGEIIRQGGIQVNNLESGQIRLLGKVEFDAPEVKDGIQLKLVVSLKNSVREIDNEWDLWVFPRRRKSIKNTNSLLMVSELTGPLINELCKGRTILLLGHKPFQALPTEFHSCSAGRVQGNMATVIRNHPVTRRFPDQGYCDWQFYRMLEGGAAVVLNEFPVAVEPVVEVVSSFKLIKKQAALFECRVGKGHLIVCTLNLLSEDPAGVYFLRRLRLYAESKNFMMAAKLDSDWLHSLLKDENSLIDANYAATDQACDATIRKNSSS